MRYTQLGVIPFYFHFLIFFPFVPEELALDNMWPLILLSESTLLYGYSDGEVGGR